MRTLASEAVWDRLGSITLAGRPIACLSPEDTVLALCLHGSKHAWERLLWICDVGAFIGCHERLYWATLIERSEALDLGRILLLGLQLAHTYCGVVLPRPVLGRVEGDPALPALSLGVRGFLLREADGGGPWLEKVASGEISGTVAFDADHVLCGAEVDVIAAVLDDHIALVPAADAKLRPVRSLDATRTLAALDVSAVGECERLPVSPEGIERARQEMTAAIAFELVGTCEAIFDTTLEYAKQRRQFGVPIGSFPVVGRGIPA